MQYTLAVDLGGTRVRVAVADGALQFLRRTVETTNLAHGPEGTIDQIVRMATEVLASAGIRAEDVGAVGVASPGPLDIRSGVLLDPPNMPGWHQVPLKRRLAERIGTPVAVINDANAAALGEFHRGAGQGLRNLVYLTVSTGIGGGVVVDGRLLEGTSGIAGEIGHMTLDRHGPVCNCGNIGCLEALASGTAIGRRFRERLAAGETSIVQQWTDTPTGADVGRAAAEGDPLALAVFTEAAEALGLGVVNCIHIFNPEVVVLGGGVTEAGDLLFDVVRRMARAHTMPAALRSVEIAPAALGEDPGLVGAAIVAQQLRNTATSSPT